VWDFLISDRLLREACRAASGALLSLGLATAAMAQSTALSQKAGEAREMIAAARQSGQVRVIVGFESPIAPAELGATAESVAGAAAEIGVVQNRIIARHFGSASAQEGQGFARGIRRFQVTPGFAVNVTRQELESLASDPLVKSIELDGRASPILNESVPLIGMNAAYSAGATGRGQVVVVLDTGIKSNHEFFVGKVIAEACFSNAAGGVDRVPLCPNGMNTQTGAGAANADTAACVNDTTNLCVHGPFVAGVAAGFNAQLQTGEPTHGVARGAAIWAIQVFTRSNSEADCGVGNAPCIFNWISDIVAALDYVRVNMASLPSGLKLASVNMSIGGLPLEDNCDDELPTVKTAIDNLRAVGVLSVIGSGNNGSVDKVTRPGCISTAITAGATTKTDALWSDSNMAGIVDVLAPGADVRSVFLQVPTSSTSYGIGSGTSIATPHVAGAIAAMRSACPSISADAIEAALESTGTPIADTRAGGTFTKPRIRVDLAVQTCASLVNDVLVDFGAGGVHQRMNNASWVKVQNSNPLAIAAGDLDGGRDEAIVSIPGSGIWARYNNAGSFVRKNTAVAMRLAAGDLDGNGKDEIIADLGGSGLWLFRNNAAWARIHTWVGQALAVGDFDGNGKEDVAVDFGARGLWVFNNNASWTQLSTGNPFYIAAGDLDGNGKDELIADRGGGTAGGIWVRANNTGAWKKIRNGATQGLETGDLDGGGKEELLADLGTAGLYALFNNSTWQRLNANSPTFIVTADLDRNGKQEVIAAFGSAGLLVRYNNAGAWMKISASVAQGLAAGGFD
jgi:hypothetical protein